MSPSPECERQTLVAAGARSGQKRQENRNCCCWWGAIGRNGERIPPPAPTHMLKSGTTPVLRAIRLLWGRMGAARFYVLAATGCDIFLAVEGAFHLARERTQSTPSEEGRTTLDAQEEFSRAMPPPKADDAIPDNPLIAITEVAPEKKFGRHGQARVDVKIGLTPQPGVRKGQVEIGLLLRHDAQSWNATYPGTGFYQWITQVRDWTDPSPKYLVATYFVLEKTHPHRRTSNMADLLCASISTVSYKTKSRNPKGCSRLCEAACGQFLLRRRPSRRRSLP